MIVEDVARVAHRWGFPGLIAKELGSDDPAIVADSIVHELAHAAVLGINPAPLWRLSATIGTFFMHYKSNYASDVSELHALAVEREVFAALEWPIAFDGIVRLAFEDLRFFRREGRLEEARAMIDDFAARELTKHRAKRVVGWLREMTP